MIERFHSPSSRTPGWRRVSAYDACAVVVAPLAALALHPANYAVSAVAISGADMRIATSCAIAGLVSLFLFRLGDGLTRFFSLTDAVRVVKTVMTAALGAALLSIFASGSEPLARDVIPLDSLLLLIALFAGRLFARLRAERSHARSLAAQSNVIILGASRLAASYLAMLESAPANAANAVAIIDICGKRVGRTLRGVPVTGSIATLSTVVEEYKVHGVSIDRILVAVPRNALSPAEAAILTVECARLRLEPEFLDERLGLCAPSRADDRAAGQAHAGLRVVQPVGAEPADAPGAYHAIRRIVDFAVASALIVVTAPVAVMVAVLVCIDVGAPVLFWQRRIGKNGRRFVVYKFRTFHAPYDRFGRPRLERASLSAIGGWLRRTRLDELPQLYNVLMGDMALIGPRPLLDVDMPENDSSRLAVRPGLTGWAQVNGGTLLSPADKNLLDCYYIAHASPLLDANIALRTFGMMLRGDRDNPAALAVARAASAKYAPAPSNSQTASAPVTVAA